MSLAECQARSVGYHVVGTARQRKLRVSSRAGPAVGIGASRTAGQASGGHVDGDGDGSPFGSFIVRRGTFFGHMWFVVVFVLERTGDAALAVCPFMENAKPSERRLSRDVNLSICLIVYHCLWFRSLRHWEDASEAVFI